MRGDSGEIPSLRGDNQCLGVGGSPRLRGDSGETPSLRGDNQCLGVGGSPRLRGDSGETPSLRGDSHREKNLCQKGGNVASRGQRSVQSSLGGIYNRGGQFNRGVRQHWMKRRV